MIKSNYYEIDIIDLKLVLFIIKKKLYLKKEILQKLNSWMETQLREKG